MAELYVDGVPVNGYLREVVRRGRTGATNREDMFWASQELHFSSTARDVLQVEFAGYRMVNHVSFLVSRFPHTVEAEYWDPQTEDWLPLRTRTGRIEPVDPAYSIAAQRSRWEGQPVSHTVSDSYPAVVTSVRDGVNGATHPQHYGTRHWVPVTWRCVPIYTRAVRLILTRPGMENQVSFVPSDPRGNHVPYSLAVKDLQVGYRVYTRDDIPDSHLASLTGFATSTDLLGSRISYRLKEYSAAEVRNDVDGLHWRSEPQPVNYAVVNFYLDVRDGEGNAQTIDRLYIDPLTVGPTMNLYWTADEPDSDFEADDSPLTYPVARVLGEPPQVERDAVGVPTVLDFSSTRPGNIQFDNSYLHWHPARSWWLGFALRLETDTGDHPLMSWVGGTDEADNPLGNTLRLNGRTVEFITTTGETVTADIPAEVAVGDALNVAVVHRADAPGEVTPMPDAGGYWAAESTVSLLVGNASASTSITREVTPEALGAKPGTVYVGTYATESLDPSDIALHGAFVQVDTLPERGVVEGFVEEPDLLLLKSAAPGLDLTRNAVVRIHPSFWNEDNEAAAVGGPGDRYEDVAWTPIPRDYVLRQGFVRFPPVAAKHFKMEFTNLVLMNFENLVPIRRKVKLFPTPMVERHQRLNVPDTSGATTYRVGLTYEHDKVMDYTSQAPGVNTMMDMLTMGNYGSAVARLREVSQNTVRQRSGTEAYVAKDPATQKRLAELGWVWSFAPWHLGCSAPRWDLRQPHRYDVVEVEHDTRTGFFVGLKHVRPYRVDYLTDDDTEVYEETFTDDRHLGDMLNVEPVEGGYTSVSNQASITSKVLPSTRQVRGVQFATIQSDNMALLPDDGFVEEDLSLNWAVYGDASIERLVGQGVMVSRGVMAETGGGGGIVSGAVQPSPSGRIYAAARVTPQTALGGALRLEIVALSSGTTIAAVEQGVVAGEEAVMQVGYEVGSAVSTTTYDDLEVMTYGDMEVGSLDEAGLWAPGTYGALQTDPIGGPVFVRLRQLGPSTDQFLVERLSIFDAPVTWEFSVDGGVTWRDAMGVRNNANAVLSFPESGNQLMWRASIFHIDAEVSNLVVRPWYGGLLGSIGRSAKDFVGPNRSVIDDYPDVEDDPMWQQSGGPIPAWWYQRDVANPYSGAPNIISRGEVITP